MIVAGCAVLSFSVLRTKCFGCSNCMCAFPTRYDLNKLNVTRYDWTSIEYTATLCWCGCEMGSHETSHVIYNQNTHETYIVPGVNTILTGRNRVNSLHDNLTTTSNGGRIGDASDASVKTPAAFNNKRKIRDISKEFNTSTSTPIIDALKKKRDNNVLGSTTSARYSSKKSSKDHELDIAIASEINSRFNFGKAQSTALKNSAPRAINPKGESSSLSLIRSYELQSSSKRNVLNNDDSDEIVTEDLEDPPTMPVPPNVGPSSQRSINKDVLVLTTSESTCGKFQSSGFQKLLDNKSAKGEYVISVTLSENDYAAILIYLAKGRPFNFGSMTHSSDKVILNPYYGDLTMMPFKEVERVYRHKFPIILVIKVHIHLSY